MRQGSGTGNGFSLKRTAGRTPKPAKRAGITFAKPFSSVRYVAIFMHLSREEYIAKQPLKVADLVTQVMDGKI